jgi:hypothetical protein
MNLTSTILLKAATYVLTLAVGGLLLIAGSQQADLGAAKKQITKLEADVRTATGKYMDMGEGFQDQLEAARSEKAVELFNTKRDLDICVENFNRQLLTCGGRKP